MVQPQATRFYFDTFQVDLASGRIVFSYSTDAGHSFKHVLTHEFPTGADPEQLSAAVFALGMSELVHYWKALLTPEIVIKAGKLSPEQIVFWETLYTKGLGEFFYVNKIDFRGLVFISVDPSAPEIPPSSISHKEIRALVPFGGGKDSLVTGELLKKQGKDFAWFELEPVPFGDALKEISGNTNSVSIGRNVKANFEQVRSLVEAGAPNGHVPITASYIFSGVLAAKANGFSDLVMSLERSANEGNVEYLGMSVNHQYSKSYEFEQEVSEYVRRHIDSGIRVFSLLRPMYELQIVREFAKYPQYFGHFVSCNRGLRTGTWCGECAKCAFMFAALSAFLPPDTVIGIFNKNLFDDEKLLPLYRDLVGEGEHKPFDCVGTVDENLLALYLSGERYKEANVLLPRILTNLPIERGVQYEPLLTAVGESLIPTDYSVV